MLAGYVIALAGTLVVTAGLLAVRGRVTATNVALAYLLVVVAAAANGGLWPGVTAAGLGFVAFDLLFLPPYGHLKVHNQQDYVSLAVYLLIALVVSVLVEARERRRAQAERREHETCTLYELSNSLLGHDSLQATLQRVATTVRSLFDLGGCAMVLPSDRAPGVVVAASDGQLPVQLPALLEASPEGEVRLREPPSGDPGRTSMLVVPMRTAQRPVGAMVLVASDDQPAGFGEVERRLLTIDQESDRLSRLVHNLLDMSRIDAGALDPQLTETTLPRSSARGCTGPAPRPASSSWSSSPRTCRPSWSTRSDSIRSSPTWSTMPAATPATSQSPSLAGRSTAGSSCA